MEEQIIADDASHYEISLTAGQAFIAFVLLLLSLAASFAFGVLIGKGQTDERLVVRHDPTVVQESRNAPAGPSKIVELGVKDPSSTARPTATTLTEEPVRTDPEHPDASAASSPAATATSQSQNPAPSVAAAAAAASPRPTPSTFPPQPGPHYAQLLSSSDAKTAEALAAKLIDNGFTTAYVERGQTDHGPIFRVRVKFSSEAEARAAVDRLKPFATGEIWITRQ